MVTPTWPQALRVGVIFAVVETITPVVGWLLGSAASRYIEAWDHWIAFGLLVGLGVHMIHNAVTGQVDADVEPVARTSGVWAIALTGLATSIDAMAVGVGLAFVDVNILVVAVVIGLCTFTLVTLGVMAGRALGALIGRRAEMGGGVVLILVGTLILYDHLGAAA